MTLWILDTNHVTLPEHRHPNILKRIEDIEEEDLAITIITAEEQIRGWFKMMNETDIKPARLVNAYKEFKNTLDYLKTVNIFGGGGDAGSGSGGEGDGSGGTKSVEGAGCY